MKGVLYPNNSIVNIANVGINENGLYCVTNKQQCCRSSDGGASGEWYLPGQASAIPGSGAQLIDNFKKKRGPSTVLLNRRNNAMSPIGLYRCEVVDVTNVLQSVYIGLYGNEGGSCSI